MAGDWLQIDLDLPEKPETQRICDVTGLDTPAVCGWLLLFWRWVDRHSTAEVIPHVSAKSLVRAVGATEALWEAMAEVGWLVFVDGGVRIPKWEERFSKGAKARLLNARRAAKHRLKDDVAPGRDESARGALPKGDVKENENESNSLDSPNGESSGEPSAVVMEFPVKPGRKNGPTVWKLTEAKLAEYRESFPDFDVLTEFRKARQWCKDSPTKRKTPGGMAAFLTRWLSKANNNGGGVRDGPVFNGKPAPVLDASIFEKPQR